MEVSKTCLRYLGVVFGTAIGDALGYPVEFINPKDVDDFTKFLPDGSAPYSDDTQMFRATCEGLLRARTWDDLDKAAEEIAAEYIAWSKSPENNRAPGNACMNGCAHLSLGVDWRKSGTPNGKGCGTAMRSMAYGLWFPGDPGPASRWAGEHAVMTHNDPDAQAAAAAVAAATAMLVEGATPSTAWTAAGIAAGGYSPDVAQMIRLALRDDPPEQVLDEWRGWKGDEAVAASLYCFLRHGGNYPRAVLEAVNSPGDSDSLGAITGAFSGGHLGVKEIPLRWLERIEKARELETLARRMWGAVDDRLQLRGESVSGLGA